MNKGATVFVQLPSERQPPLSTGLRVQRLEMVYGNSAQPVILSTIPSSDRLKCVYGRGG